MKSTFCIWAPWVFSLLAGIIGWLLRWWYDDKKIQDYEIRIKSKEEDIYHLNEAHNLLLHDKEKKLANLQAERDIKERTIRELTHQVEQAETTNKSLLSQVVDEKKKASIDRKTQATPSATIKVMESPDKSKNQSSKKSKGSNKKVLKLIRTKKGKKNRYKRKIKKYKKRLAGLKAENKRLSAAFPATKIRIKKIIREIPITITRTILKKERINKKKLKAYLKKLPLKKTKKLVSKKTKRGKAVVIRED